MKIMFDHNTPAALRKYLPGHNVDTAAEKGWNELVNSALLDCAETHSYDVLITGDKKMPSQQNLSARPLGFIILPTNDWKYVKHMAPSIREELATIRPGDVVFIEMPSHCS